MSRQIPTVSNLDFGVPERQAFGTSYERPKDLETRLEVYKQGKLILPPQPIWTGDPTDWTADPFKDRNWRFQHHTLRWLNPLRWAALEGDQEARAEWIRVAHSWAEANVPAADSKSDFAWKDMADGNRAIQLSLGAPLVDSQDDWFVELLEYHRDWLSEPTNIVTKNHALHQHSGLLVVGAVLRDRDAVRLAVNRMREQFDTTFDSQGANDEGSVGYHQLNMIWWSESWDRVRNEGVTPPDGVSNRLAKAANALAHMSMPNGRLPQIGDGGRTKLRLGLADTTDFIASAGRKGIPPNDNLLIVDRGYILSHSGWGKTKPLIEESHTLIRFGEAISPRAHSHQDRGSVHIYASGQPWLVDSGFHSYQPSAPENKYLISRQAHNIASIVGQEHDAKAEVELISSNVTSAFHDFVLKDCGYENSALYRRVIYFLEADCWIIVDNADSEENLQVSQNWFIEPGTIARFLDNGFRLDGASASFGMYWLGRGTQLSLARAQEESMDGWIGTKWRTLVPGSRITAKSRSGSAQLIALFGSHDKVPLSIVESRVSVNGHIRAHIGRGSSYWKINIDGEKVSIERG